MDETTEIEQTEKRKFTKQTLDRVSVIFLLIGVIVLLCLGAYSSLASKNKEVESDNIITSGEIKTQILNLDANRNPFPASISNLYPGTHIDNCVYAKNVSEEQTEWVRIKVRTRITDGDGNLLPTDEITYEFNEDDWIYKDGFWYYKEPIEVGEVSAALYTGILFSKNLDNRYAEAQMTTNLELDAVQYVNNTDNVLDAVGWDD